MLETIFDTSRYHSQIERDRSRLIYGILTLLFIAVVVGLFIVRNETGTTGFQTLIDGNANATLPTIFILSLVGYFATKYHQLFLSRWIPLFILYIMLTIPLLQGTYSNTLAADGYTLLIVIAAVIHQNKGLIITTGMVILTLILLAVGTNALSFAAVTVDIMIIILIVLVIELFKRLIGSQAEIDTEIEIRERLQLADINNQIAQRATQQESLQNILDHAINLILENRPEIYHAQVFLTNQAGDHAELRASTGTVGQTLIERGHALKIGSTSVIGQVSLYGKPIIATTNSNNTVHQRNEFLADTRLEAAFPLRIEENVIGALDLQSKEDLELLEEDIRTFQSIADTIALAVESRNQFERAEERLRENQELVKELETSIIKVERLNERLVGRSWSEYLHDVQNEIGIDIDFDINQKTHNAKWTPALTEAFQTSGLVMETEPEQTIAIPLQFRGQLIGAMEFELNEQQPIDPQLIQLIYEVGGRLGQIADNIRLVQVSQNTAQREAIANEIGARLQGTQNVETTLAEAARSLQAATSANRIAIRLVPIAKENGQG